MAKLFYNYGLVCLYSIFSLFAVLYSCSNLTTYVSFKDSINIIFVLLILCLFFLFYKYAMSKIAGLSVHAISLGIFAGVINVLGRNFMLYNSVIFLYKEKYFAIVFSLLAAIGYGLIYALVFELGWKYLSSMNQSASCSQNSVSYIMFDQHPFKYPFLVIFVFWAPYFVAFYPGVVHWDAMFALRQYYGLNTWTSHFPVVGVLLMGWTMDIGKYLGSDNYGCTIYIVLQYLFYSLTLAYSFVFYKKWKTPYGLRWVTLLVFSFLPVIPMYAVNEIKDTLYYIVLQWLLYCFIIALDKNDNNIYSLFLFFISLTCCFRKEGVLICIACIVMLLIFKKNIYDNWIKIISSIIIGIFCYTLITSLLCIHYQIKPGSMREALSLPAQQTARFVKSHGKDITKSEWKVLNEIFGNKAKELGKVYDPNRSDNAKDRMINVLSDKQKKDYFKIWLGQFFKHPGCYFSAAFNQMYGYFYIGKPAFKGSSYFTNNFKNGHPLYTKNIHVTDCARTKGLRDSMIEFVSMWENNSILSLLSRPSTYVWLLFFVFTSFIHLRNYKYLFFLCIPIVCLVVCCLSPLNGSIRYGYPIMLNSILLLAFSIKINQKQDDLFENIKPI